MMTVLDSLYCEEPHQWEDDNEDDDIPHPTPQQDHDLSSLISKESQQHTLRHLHHGGSAHHRRDAVDWILAVASHYSFSALTAVLAVDYLDRFLEGLETEQKPWMTQLAAVSCLSIAAKVEETHVPLLLDLQMEGSAYVFEAKTIQKMEVLILSSLEWRMNPVTPLSFLEYMTRRLGLESSLSSEFIKRCECLLLCFLPDSRFRCHLPSVMATATMVHVINSVEPCIGSEYQSQLLGILGINKLQQEKMEECLSQIQEITCSRNPGRHFMKRKFGAVPGSPNAVLDLCFSSETEPWPAKKGRKGGGA